MEDLTDEIFWQRWWRWVVGGGFELKVARFLSMFVFCLLNKTITTHWS
jgi:hypothetical protein